MWEEQLVDPPIYYLTYANPIFWDWVMLMNANPVTGIVYVSDLTLTKV